MSKSPSLLVHTSKGEIHTTHTQRQTHTHTHTHTHTMSYSRSGRGSREWWWGLHFPQGIKGKSLGGRAVWRAWLKQGSVHVGVREKGALGWGHSEQRAQGAICLLLEDPKKASAAGAEGGSSGRKWGDKNGILCSDLGDWAVLVPTTDLWTLVSKPDWGLKCSWKYPGGYEICKWRLEKMAL